MPTALFISPHLDDAAFSGGGTAARLAGLGWRVTLTTVFTQSVPEPTGFALACQTDKGIPADVDYMALRRTEDALVCERLGAEALWLGHPEAPHRGYESPGELFTGVLPEDDVHQAVREDLDGVLRDLEPELVFAPQGLGGHVDHLQVIRAIREVSRKRPDTSTRLLYYRDTPYAIREPRAAPEPPREAGVITETGVEIRPELPRKLDACEGYESQLGFQFGGVAAMREALADFSESEGVRLGLGSPAEAYLGSPAAARSLGEADGKAN